MPPGHGPLPRRACAAAEQSASAGRRESCPTRCCCSSTRPSTRAGGARHAGELPLGEDFYRARGIEIVETDRGGRVTYHGPGPAGRLSDHARRRHRRPSAHDGSGDRRGARRARASRRARAARRVPTTRACGCEDRKIASIGVHVSRGITTHGFAVNVDNDLEPFSWVIACGLPDVAMTSIARELPATPRSALGAPRRASRRAHGSPRVARVARSLQQRSRAADAPDRAPRGGAR